MEIRSGVIARDLDRGVTGVRDPEDVGVDTACDVPGVLVPDVQPSRRRVSARPTRWSDSALTGLPLTLGVDVDVVVTFALAARLGTRLLDRCRWVLGAP